MLRTSVLKKKICQHQNNVLRPKPTPYNGGKTLFAKLINDVQDPEWFPLMSTVVYEVI